MFATIRRFGGFVGAIALWTALQATGVQAQALPAPGLVSNYQGAQLDGLQCVGAARNLASVLLKRTVPPLGTSGVAADLWTVNLPGWSKIANDGKKLPPARGCLIVWARSLPGSGNAGHVAYCAGTVDPASRKVRVVDGNYQLDQKGRIHDVTINNYVLGWIVPS
jgi:hypothetical protein